MRKKGGKKREQWEREEERRSLQVQCKSVRSFRSSEPCAESWLEDFLTSK